MMCLFGEINPSKFSVIANNTNNKKTVIFTMGVWLVSV